MRGNLQLLICSALLCAAGLGGLGAVVPDLAQVEGIDKYPGSDEGKRLLQENGFVVEPEFHNQLFTIYERDILPHYATADSIHNTFHTIFEKELKNLETGMRLRVLCLTQRMLAPLPKSADPNTVFARDYFRVAECLLTDMEPAASETKVAAEIQLIRAASAVTDSPLFGYEMDYTQFKPRGFYTETPELRAFFRAMSWYGNAAFRLKSRQETAVACLIAHTLNAEPGLADIWKSIDKVYTGFLGTCDDLTPIEYAEAMATGERADMALGKLRDPRINSMVLSPVQMENWQQETKGMRFLGKRYLIDSEVFMSVTTPEVRERLFPTGLDMMAANGSTRARELIDASPEAKLPGYTPALAKAQAAATQAKQVKPPTHYTAFLKVLDTLFQPAQSDAPAFAKTKAYSDKNLLTSLAAWSCERHAWALQAKQPVVTGGMGIPEPLRGYVEPNEAFFESMHELITITVKLFTEVPGSKVDKLQQLDTLTLQLKGMVRKELAGAPFTKEEDELLVEYYHTIGGLQGFQTGGAQSHTFPQMGLIIDVHSEMLTAQCLEVATGGAMPIYIAVQHGGRWYLCMGGIYSYHEFLQPIRDRLTDDAWRNRLASRNTEGSPALPAWTASFVAPRRALSSSSTDDRVRTAIEEIRQGKESGVAQGCSDPALDAFLENAVRLGGELMGKPNHRWALTLATERLGRTMVPILFEFIRTAPVSSSLRDATKEEPPALDAAFAAFILREVIALEDFPAIAALVENDPERGRDALCAVVKPIDPSVVDFLFEIACKHNDPRTRACAANKLSWIAGKDQTPKILELLPRMDAKTQGIMLDGIGRAWYPRFWSEEDRFPSVATIPELKTMQQNLKQALTKFIEAHPDSDSDSGIWTYDVKDLLKRFP